MFVIRVNEAALAAFKACEAAGGSVEAMLDAGAAVREAAWAADDVPPKPPPHFPNDGDDPGATYQQLVALKARRLDAGFEASSSRLSSTSSPVKPGSDEI